MKKPTSRTQDGKRAAKAGRGKHKRPHPTYTPEFKRKAITLHLEEQMPLKDIQQATGAHMVSIRTWVRRYQQLGEAAFGSPGCVPARGREQVAAPVKAQIVELKKENPSLGVKSISQMLKRFFFMGASPETVRATLQAKSLQPSAPPPKPQRDPPKPRFFERATPNQMWQSDITTFRMGGKVIYVIGFIDDYSRFITGLEMFHSQSAENVMEVFRRAGADYGPPKEMLTDNGRQYAAWRGRTRFQVELQKAGIHHIRATPHHPMTLGKIERFWQTLKDDFLHRTQFATFEEGRERIRFWTKWYNHRRPNQGIDGLCPADRFFEIRNELRKVMEQGIQENQLELALRGQPQTPFYMVGKLDKQSVVMQTRGGKLVMTVSDENEKTGKEVVCDLERGKVDYDQQHEGKESRTAADTAVHGDAEGSGGAAALDGEDDAVPTGQGAGADLDAADAMAGPGDGGDARRAGAEEPPVPEAVAAELAAAAVAGEEGGQGAGDRAAAEPEPGEAAGGTPAKAPGEGNGGGDLMALAETAGNAPPRPPTALAPAAAAPTPEGGPSGAGNGIPATAGIPPILLAAALNQLLANGDLQRYLLSLPGNCQPAGTTTNHGQQADSVERGTAGESHAPGRPHHGGPRQDEVADRGGGGTGGLAQDLLRMGGAGADGNGRGPDGQGTRSPHETAAGPRAAQAREAGPGAAEGDRATAPDGSHPRSARPVAATPAGTGPGAANSQ